MSDLAEPLFALNGVTKLYGQNLALSIDSLSISQGGIHLIAGANGAGKTTLLEILCALNQPSSGEVFFRGRPVFPETSGIPTLRRSVAMVIQNPFLFRTSVARLASLGLRFRKVSRPERSHLVSRALSALGVEHLSSRPTSQLSGGERQRAAIAAALAAGPSVLILDEPLADLDLATALSLLAFLRKLADSAPVTILISTHELNRCLGISDREIYLDKGVLAPLPIPNLISGRIAIENGEAFFQLPGVPRIRVNAASPGPCRISIPPDSVILSRQPIHSSVRNSLPARVAACSLLPDGKVEVLLDVGFQLRAFITPESQRSLSLSVGGEVLASFKASAVSVFQAPSL